MLEALYIAAIKYTVRTCVGRSDDAYNSLQFHVLGHLPLAADCTPSVLSEPDLTVLYSSDRRHPLYDMIYKVGSIYYAFKITLGSTHEVKQDENDELVERLEIITKGRELRLY